MRKSFMFFAVGVLAAALAAGAALAQGGSAACDRACLEGFVDKYLDAVIAHDPKLVPLARGVRFTENGVRLEIGDSHWKTVTAKGTCRLFVTDTEAGQVAFIGTAAPNLERLGTPHRSFLEVIPPAERMSREDLIKTANMYFSGMEKNDGKGLYPFTDDCNRIENGSLTTNVPLREGQTRPDPKTATGYSSAWGCKEQFESGLIHFVWRIRDRRYVAVDQERGLVFSFAFFDHALGKDRTFQTPAGRTVTGGPPDPWTWQLAEMFKIEKGKLRQIEAVLQRAPYGMNSGWSGWEDGLSSAARDVTKSSGR